jgi:hypothetical protein
MEEIKLDDIKFTYSILRHRGPTELRFLKEGNFPIIKFVKNMDDFISNCLKFNGKRNIYTGIRDRRVDIKYAAKKEDIVGLNLVVIDIDPVRPRESPSTEEELNRSIYLSEKIRNFFLEKNFNPPLRGMTGNGVSLFFITPYYEIDEKNRDEIEDSILWFENYIRENFKDELKKMNLRIDNMYDLPRIVKVIGTKNIKGIEEKDRPHRVSYWIDKENFSEDEKILMFILKRGEDFNETSLKPIYLMQPIPYFGEELAGDWIVEPKIDGWRLQIIKNNNKIFYFGRRLEKNPDWTEKLKIPKDIFEEVPDGTILDGELYSDKGRRGIPSLFSNSGKANPIIFIFDIIYLGYEFIGNLPLFKRKEILNSIKFKGPVKVLEYEKFIDLEKSLKEKISLGYEGIVIKEINSKYVVLKEGPFVTLYWKKIKGTRRY